MSEENKNGHAGNQDTPSGGSSGHYWTELDKDKCSLCEMCARKCPTGALTLNPAGDIEQLLFTARLCDSCSGEVLCEIHCPEDAIKVIEGKGGSPMPADERVLFEGEMAACKGCGQYFMPLLKLETLLKQSKIEEQDYQRFCPACRRQHLITNYPSKNDNRT
ncbi:ATP-binding protein [Acidobacteriota bacterium]